MSFPPRCPYHLSTVHAIDTADPGPEAPAILLRVRYPGDEP